MAQIPDAFDRAHPCIVTGTSSGSRGIYGAIATSGEWGLKHGCAVAYTDKGTGNGMHDLEHGTVGLIDGTRAQASSAGTHATFLATMASGADMTTFNATTPHRVAYKHAHSQLNPEKDWGQNTLDAIAFTFWALDDALGAVNAKGEHLAEFRPDNTIVIASSVSNGGGAALAAAEQDSNGVIDAVVVGEPQVQTDEKPLYDYLSYANLFQLCASLAPSASPTGSLGDGATLATARCNSLHLKGLLTSMTTADQAAEALQKLHDYGFRSEGDALVSTHADVTTSVVVAYANAYGKFAASDNVCGFSYGASDATSGAPVALPDASALTSFAAGNGIPPTAGIGIIYNTSMGGAAQTKLATSPSTFAKDRALDGDICLRSLWTGTDPVTGFALVGTALDWSQRVHAGVADVMRSGNLHGKPAIIVQGRSDTLLPVAHTGRAYTAKNAAAESAGSHLAYYEIENAQHLDVLAAVPGLDTRIVPLAPYLFQSLDMMLAHLQTGAIIAPSQVVRTTPRGGNAGAAPAITHANVPAIAATPAQSNVITVSGSALSVPQ
jgi:hydroxybutyrate-dimer hydrolase